LDWEAEQLRVKLRIETAQARIEQLRLRRAELAAWPSRARGVDAASERLRRAVERATAAELAAAEQLERCADAHDSAARTLDFAAKRARDDFLAETQIHVAEAHRFAARNDRELAGQYRDEAKQRDSD
jgi:hypothetical protein